MLEVLGRNFSRNIESVRAYEIGKTFMKNLIDPKGLPDESYDLTIGCYGENEDFYSLKGMVCTLLDRLGIRELKFVAESEYGVYHPGRCARVVTSDTNGQEVELGIMGEVHPDVAENFGIDTRAYCCELFFDLIDELSDREVQYHQPPKYPSTSRDMALIVDEDLEIGEIEAQVNAMGIGILRDIKLFDVYRGEQVEQGKKSVAFSLTYRDDEKTLTDEETDEAHNSVVEMLKEKFGATLRD